MKESVDQEETCPICFENKEDLRMLPCWHIACMNCILNMAQRGQGRAVKCHECRQPCLFENIRYLPKPLRCGSCNQFLKNSKLMPCCSKPFCVDCIKKISSINGNELLCPGRCSSQSFNLDELPQSKLCSLCFRLHTDNNNSACEHSVCDGCNQKLQSVERGCPLCSAVNNPAPAPVDPIQSNPDQVEITMEGLENLNYRPPQHNRMNAFVALQFLNMIREINREQRINASIEDIEAARVKKNIREDMPKICFVILFSLVAGYLYGIGLEMWIILWATMLLMRPHFESVEFILQIITVGLLILAIYSYFYQFIVFTVIEIGISIPLEIMYRIAFNNLDFYRPIFHVWVGSVIRLAIAWTFFSSLIFQEALSGWFLVLVKERIKTPSR